MGSEKIDIRDLRDGKFLWIDNAALKFISENAGTLGVAVYSWLCYYANFKDFVEYNLMAIEPLPFDDNSIEVIYSSHTIEHVSDEAIQNLLKESYRVLKKGGGIRLTTPDIELEYNAFKNNERKAQPSPNWGLK